MARAIRRDLPPSKVVIRDGRVVRVDVYTLWNLEPAMTIQVGQETDQKLRSRGEFFCYISTPEHGGGSRRGSLQEVLSGLHPTIRQEYLDLFALSGADETSVRALQGFRRHQVELQAT